MESVLRVQSLYEEGNGDREEEHQAPRINVERIEKKRKKGDHLRLWRHFKLGGKVTDRRDSKNEQK